MNLPRPRNFVCGVLKPLSALSRESFERHRTVAAARRARRVELSFEGTNCSAPDLDRSASRAPEWETASLACQQRRRRAGARVALASRRWIGI